MQAERLDGRRVLLALLASNIALVAAFVAWVWF